MKFSRLCPDQAKRRQFAERSAFTLLEVLVASSCASVIIAGAAVFLTFARVSVSGIAAQAMVSDRSANAIAFMRSRIRIATSVAVDTTGNTLTLGFDDDYQTDSDGDGSAYNDNDHYETFKFTGTNGTNSATSAANRLIYTPRVGVAGSSVLVPFGVRNLPGYNIFSVPNSGIVVIRFGMVDSSTRDRFQSVDIQATGVSLNRPPSSSVVGVLPY